MKIRIIDGNSILKEINNIDLLEELLLSLIEDKGDEEVKENPKEEVKKESKCNHKDFSLTDILPNLKVSKVLSEQDVKDKYPKYFGEDLVNKNNDFNRNLFDVYRDVLSKEEEEEKEEKEEVKQDIVKYIDFSAALKSLKLGEKLARKGWNGKGMYVKLVKPINSKNTLSTEFNMPKYNPYFTIKNVDDSISVWVPSVGDTLAEDWYIVK